MSRDELKRRQKLLGHRLAVIAFSIENDLDPLTVMLHDLEHLYRDIVDNVAAQGASQDDIDAD